MEITKVTKKGNIYVTLSNGKWAGIYPKTKYVRFKTNQDNPYHHCQFIYQVKRKFKDIKEQIEYLLAYEEKYCKNNT